MAPPKRDAVHRFFLFEDASNYSECSLCGNKLKGKHTTNLKNHLAVKHSVTYHEVLTLNKEITSLKNKDSTNDIIATIKDICVKLVAVHGRPLALLNDKPFQKLISLAAPSNARIREINDKAIKAMIPDVAYNLKLKIAAEIRHKLVSLKVDSATCNDRRFIGINIQFIKDAQIIVRNLTVSEVNERQTGEFLKKKLLEVSNEFMIAKEQIYSITSDNGANMKKMVRLLGGSYYSEDEQIVDLVQVSEDESDDENHRADHVFEQSQDTFVSQLAVMENFLNTNENDLKIRGMLCAAHTLQLVVTDGISDNLEVQMSFDVARRISKLLRTPSNRNLLKLTNLKIPILDCPTRWTSKYNMLKRLYELRDFCNNIVEITLITSNLFWNDIVDILHCLEPFSKSTLILQNEQLTIGDFFINWMACKTQIETICHPFASSLHKAMESRERSLLDTDVVLEGLYLDGRLNVVLSEEQSQKAKTLLKQTWARLQIHNVEKQIVSDSNNTLPHLSSQDEYPEQPGPSTRQCSPENQAQSIYMSNDLMRIEEILVRTERTRRLPPVRMSSIDTIIHELRNLPRLSLNTNIIQHWHNKSACNSEIAELANTVLATPVTQVSVERMFSALKFLFSPLRCNLNSNLLRDMLLIKSNKDLL